MTRNSVVNLLAEVKSTALRGPVRAVYSISIVTRLGSERTGAGNTPTDEKLDWIALGGRERTYWEWSSCP